MRRLCSYLCAGPVCLPGCSRIGWAVPDVTDPKKPPGLTVPVDRRGSPPATAVEATEDARAGKTEALPSRFFKNEVPPGRELTFALID
jgi:hypothetical protein